MWQELPEQYYCFLKLCTQQKHLLGMSGKGCLAWWVLLLHDGIDSCSQYLFMTHKCSKMCCETLLVRAESRAGSGVLCCWCPEHHFPPPTWANSSQQPRGDVSALKCKIFHNVQFSLLGYLHFYITCCNSSWAPAQSDPVLWPPKKLHTFSCAVAQTCEAALYPPSRLCIKSEENQLLKLAL